ncbi:hypothetical protein GCM10007160_05720 [Litchfieldella qijiaojingensis]|uniref:DUF1285 domain-containing protein n=1 Tax=Litchfieldella qijiaojingensis TaxID=980347 RepID=A0ABQ2YEP5_9GAMM|nr:DUF1285 domain-containing protein [Halomonas qijiaojingensis]GGX81269.1 hypothetical protein GCM10007160_05720 [Halomonas qijiaojingensis]
MSLEPLLAHIDPEGDIAPVDRWDPPLSGEMDLVIAADGRWIHEGVVFTRPRLIRLLSTILRRDADGDYYLVSPQEKWRIHVEDRPFLVVDAEQQNTNWTLTTNVGDRVMLDASHSFSLSKTPSGVVVPEVPVRFGLSARLNRNVYYHLVERAESREQDGDVELGLLSGEHWHPLGRLGVDAS